MSAERAQALAQRLTMYKLRAKVDISVSDHRVFCIRDGDLGHSDPRHPALGWRFYSETAPQMDAWDVDWDALRVEHLIPQSGKELIPDQSFILECGFERLNGVDFKKGCYVGQEVTARMKHKTELRKGLARVSVSQPIAEGTEITSDGKSVGVVHTVAGHQAIAYLRFDRAKGEMMAGEAEVLRLTHFSSELLILPSFLSHSRTEEILG